MRIVFKALTHSTGWSHMEFDPGTPIDEMISECFCEWSWEDPDEIMDDGYDHAYSCRDSKGHLIGRFQLIQGTDLDATILRNYADQTVFPTGN